MPKNPRPSSPIAIQTRNSSLDTPHHAPEDLLEKARRLETLLRNLDGLVFRCRGDSKWTMEFVSEGCFKLTGYRPEELLGNSKISYEDVTHPEDRHRVREEIHSALRQHRGYFVEYRIVCADGSVKWVWERGSALFDTDGDILALEGFIEDVTERKLVTEAHQQAERRYRSIFENAIEGIFQTTPEGRYLAVNPALAQMYGYGSPTELIAALTDIGGQLYVDPGRRAEFIRIMEEKGNVTNFEYLIYRKDGSTIWISENARAVRDEAGRILFFEGTVVDITAVKTYRENLQYLATHDMLTNLPNRRFLVERLNQGIHHSRRAGQLMAVAFVDLDQFKMVNDSLGHNAGDHLLQMMSRRLVECLRGEDTVARQGGDEFVFVLLEVPSVEQLSHVMERIVQQIARPVEIQGQVFSISCSVGISIYPQDGTDAETLLKNADAAMYRAKELGRNNVQFYSKDMNERIAERWALEGKLRFALQRDELFLQYQPRIDLASGRILGAEALVRWRHPDLGIISPEKFIPIAEDTGLIIPIGEWVLKTACAQNRAWQQEGLPPIVVSVNLSPRQFQQGDLVETVSQILEDTALDPACLELELTETLVMGNAEKFTATLKKLKALGVYLAIDDFGTGYSSLSYLKRFPVDRLKVDQSFVRDIPQDPDDAAIVKAIISLGHSLGLVVTAEGVETADQLAHLQNHHCNEIQGFLFSPPILAERLAELLGAVNSENCLLPTPY